MTKTFKRFNLNDRSKAYRRNDKKAYRTHFKSTIRDHNGFDDFEMPNRKHYGKINYKMINFNDTIEMNGFVSPKDINGNSSIMSETKNKFYKNTTQTKLLNEFNELIKEHENFNNEEKEHHDSIWRTFDYYSDYFEYRFNCGCTNCI